jgi:hypothetical protein
MVVEIAVDIVVGVAAGGGLKVTSFGIVDNAVWLINAAVVTADILLKVGLCAASASIIPVIDYDTALFHGFSAPSMLDRAKGLYTKRCRELENGLAICLDRSLYILQLAPLCLKW